MAPEPKALDPEQLTAIVEAAPDALIVVDEQGTVVFANHQAEVLFGCAKDAIVGHPVEDLLPEQLRQVHRAHRTRYRAEPKTRAMGASMALSARRHDGTEFPVEVSLSPLPGPGPGRAVAAVRDITDRMRSEAEARDAEERLRAIAQDLHTLEDRERIAEDLHDLVIQRLFAAGMTLQATTAMVESPAAAARIGGAVDELDQTIREIRTVIFGLQTDPTAQLGLRSDVLRVISDERHVLGVEPRVQFDGPVDTTPEPIAEQLVATLREALSNVARHAEAENVRVSITAGAELVLEVSDDGTGIPDEPALGEGLRNMARRAERFGGTMAATPGGDGQGTTVRWTVPLS